MEAWIRAIQAHMVGDPMKALIAAKKDQQAAAKVPALPFSSLFTPLSISSYPPSSPFSIPPPPLSLLPILPLSLLPILPSSPLLSIAPPSSSSFTFLALPGDSDARGLTFSLFASFYPVQPKVASTAASVPLAPPQHCRFDTEEELLAQETRKSERLGNCVGVEELPHILPASLSTVVAAPVVLEWEGAPYRPSGDTDEGLLWGVLQGAPLSVTLLCTDHCFYIFAIEFGLTVRGARDE